jgi:hypothetical protein
MRKILSLETDLVAVNIDFTAKQGITEQGFFAPVLSAFKNAGRVMMESFAGVITFHCERNSLVINWCSSDLVGKKILEQD